MENTQKILERATQVLITNYARLPVVMARGEGSFLWDTDGRRYIDLFAGFGGAILGHSHPALINAATKQAQTLWHVGNTFYTTPQIDAAEAIARHAFAGRAFFCHSGLEANEAACKAARLRGNKENTPGKWKVISLNKSFHGRSLAMIYATGNPKTRQGFEPPVPGFLQVEPGDFAALEKAVDDQTAGIIMEPIQGEGGINHFSIEYVEKVRKLCDDRHMTLIFDEVWTGCGRTGKWFAHQHFTRPDGSVIEPDIMTLAKAVGGGLPVGVMWAKPHIAKYLVPGTHGCTLGANPICMAVTRRIIEVMEDENLVEHAAEMGELARKKLAADSRIASKIAEIRGRGLMLGIELKQPPQRMVEHGLEHGVVLNLTAQNVVRLAPPINIPREVFEQGLEATIKTIAAA